MCVQLVRHSPCNESTHKHTNLLVCAWRQSISSSVKSSCCQMVSIIGKCASATSCQPRSNLSLLSFVCWGLRDDSSNGGECAREARVFSPMTHVLEWAPVIDLGSTCLPSSFKGNCHWETLPLTLSPRMVVRMHSSVTASVSFLPAAASQSGCRCNGMAKKVQNVFSFTLISMCKMQTAMSPTAHLNATSFALACRSTADLAMAIIFSATISSLSLV